MYLCEGLPGRNPHCQPISLLELGRWVAQASEDFPLVVAIHPDYPLRWEILLRLRRARPDIPVAHNLVDAIQNAERIVQGKPVIHKPLVVPPEFQQIQKEIDEEFERFARANLLQFYFSAISPRFDNDPRIFWPLALYELGRQAALKKTLVVGADSNYPRQKDLIRQLGHTRPDIPILDRLYDVSQRGRYLMKEMGVAAQDIHPSIEMEY
jgi:hypothetical protein